jgi:putative transcriptional regulator
MNFFSPKASLEGHLLVASPHLRGDNFCQTVIMLLQHDENGAFGVVLNRPSNETVSGLMSKLGVADCQAGGRILVGGPVSGALIALHSNPKCSEHSLPGGIHLASQKGLIFELASETPEFVRFFVGHAAWRDGQLETELAEGLWHVLPCNWSAIESLPADELWSMAVREVGQQVYDTLGVPRSPVDPAWN